MTGGWGRAAAAPPERRRVGGAGSTGSQYFKTDSPGVCDNLPGWLKSKRYASMLPRVMLRPAHPLRVGASGVEVSCSIIIFSGGQSRSKISGHLRATQVDI